MNDSANILEASIIAELNRVKTTVAEFAVYRINILLWFHQLALLTILNTVSKLVKRLKIKNTIAYSYVVMENMDRDSKPFVVSTINSMLTLKINMQKPSKEICLNFVHP